MNLPHRASVKRPSVSIADHEETQGAWTEVYSSLRCLLEPMPAWRQATILGDIGGGRFSFTWGSETLQEGDRVTVTSRVFEFKKEFEDVWRPAHETSIEPFQTGVLEELSPNRLP